VVSVLIGVPVVGDQSKALGPVSRVRRAGTASVGALAGVDGPDIGVLRRDLAVQRNHTAAQDASALCAHPPGIGGGGVQRGQRRVLWWRGDRTAAAPPWRR